MFYLRAVTYDKEDLFRVMSDNDIKKLKRCSGNVIRKVMLFKETTQRTLDVLAAQWREETDEYVLGLGDMKLIRIMRDLILEDQHNGKEVKNCPRVLKCLSVGADCESGLVISLEEIKREVKEEETSNGSGEA